MQLIPGDCLKVMGEIPDGSVDLIATDLPYGMTAGKWDAVIPFGPLWAHFRRVLKPNGAVALTASQPFTSMLVMSNPDWFRHEWIWVKNRGANFGSVRRRPMHEHDSILIFSPGHWTYNPQKQERAPSGADRVRYPKASYADSGFYSHQPQAKVVILDGLRWPSSCQKFNTEVGLHPSQKPLALFEYLIRTYSDEGDTVLDCCMGSGTTGVACLRTGRRFIGIEKDPKFFDIARRRIDAERSKTPLLGSVV
jgi:site-specific DNA-methyltransferase (adenine-specific)